MGSRCEEVTVSKWKSRSVFLSVSGPAFLYVSLYVCSLVCELACICECGDITLGVGCGGSGKQQDFQFP